MNDSLNRHEQLEQFVSIIISLTAVVVDITNIENNKALAAANGQHELMDGYIRDEQACILKLRGLEQRRLNLADMLGWKDLTFNQILEQGNAADTDPLRPLFSELKSQITRLTESRNNSDRMIKSRLREFELLADTFAPSFHIHDQFV